MSEISKEHDGKLRELRDDLKRWQGYYHPVDDKEQHEMFALAADAVAELLALRERAEPVGEVALGSRDDEGNYPHAHVICLAGEGCADWDNFPDGFKLYTAPPAPVVVDAAAAIRACMDEFPESVHDIVEECADIAENAFRDAMV
ncbi:hypothetical protein SMX72_003260 [Cronobacter sakazakii]|nr:hypothetical protein [Cronobacter sakazakii]